MPGKKDFVVKDRRIFSDDDQKDKTVEDKAKSRKEKPEARKPPEKASSTVEDNNYQLPEITFSTFIFSLNSSVLVHLGLIEDPATGKKVKNLPLAKQTIDILGMLEEKTRGNLTNDEKNMLKNILYDLRMIYVKEQG